MLIDFQDAVTAANLDPNQTHAVFYVDGVYANRAAVAARCPRAKLYGITVRGQTGPGVFACDCEPGDLTVPHAVAWVETQIALGVQLVCVYASLDTWLNQGLKARLDKYGNRIKRWVAHFDNVRAIPSWADAEQYADPGPVDRNVALANFFGDAAPAPAPIPTPIPPEGTVALFVATNQDGRLAVFVELASGEVKHIEQQAANGDWWKDDQGNFRWLSLGNPGR